MGKKGKNSTVSLKGMLLGLTLCAALGLGAFSGTARAAGEDPTASIDVSLKNLKLGLLAYIEYAAGTTAIPEAEQDDQGENYNKFNLNRAYVTFEKELTPYLSARITTDIYQETKGKGTSGDGSYVVRMKYAYGLLKIPDLGPITSIKTEIGMGHTPWLDFEDSINMYRAQGTMPSERAGFLPSADLGVNFMGYFGGTLDNAKKLTGTDKFAGRFGSWNIGVYNGGGYNATENNQNKVVQGRLTIRPLSMIDMLAGLQLSYFGLFGEGNKLYLDADGKDVYPEFTANLGMLSYQNSFVAANAQYFQSVGNHKGEWVFTNEDGDTESYKTEGYSFFVNVKLPIMDKKPAVFARYDYFDEDAGDELEYADGNDAETSYDTIMGGISYDFYKGNMVILCYEQTDFDEDAGVIGKVPALENKLGMENKLQVIFQVKL